MRILLVIGLLALTVLTGLSQNAFADAAPPPSFEIKDGRLIFVDFLHAGHILEFDVQAKKATFRSKIRFRATETGFPVIDSGNRISSATLDGESVSFSETDVPSPYYNQVTFIKRAVAPGEHVLETVHFGEGLQWVLKEMFEKGGVNYAFQMDDRGRSGSSSQREIEWRRQKK